MPTEKLTAPIEFDQYYHIYNRGNNRDLLFYKEYNYSYFLKKYQEYLVDHVFTFAYCLLPNHFHFLIKTKTDKVSDQFKKLFQSYALSINKQENRTGSLFTKPFRRIKIEDDDYFKYLTFYIHYNPEKHQVCDDFKKYQNSSFKILIDDSKSFINREDTFEWFGGKQDFIDFHNYYHEEKKIQKYTFE